MLNTHLSPWPSYSEQEIDAVSRVLRSNKVNYWTGQEGRLFEKEFAEFCQSQYAIALANGTLALDLALYALDLGVGDEVIVTSRTFIASVSSIINCGAMPVFADVDLDSQNICATSIAEHITPKTKAIVCVHLAGWPCDMDEIMALAKQHNLYVIEDCAQAHGATYKGQPVGSIGDIGAWSFCQDKIMTTGGEGGMLTTNDEQLWRKAWAYKDHGKSYQAVYEKEHPPGYRWLHESFGTNWRLTEMQSAIGRWQLTQMPEWTKLRTHYAHQLFECMSRFDFIRIPEIPDNIGHAFYKCYVFIEPSQLPENWQRDDIINALNELKVPCYSGSCSEVYLEKAFDQHPSRPAVPLPNAQTLGQTSLMFLVHPSLTQVEVDQMCDQIQRLLSKIETNV